MVLISTVVGGLFLYVIFERYLKKALHRTHDHRKVFEIGTLVAAISAVVLAAGSLAYTLTAIDALEERVIALEKAARNLPQGR
jgi:predicted O-methyltransferase YrrM